MFSCGRRLEQTGSYPPFSHELLVRQRLRITGGFVSSSARTLILGGCEGKFHLTEQPRFPIFINFPSKTHQGHCAFPELFPVSRIVHLFRYIRIDRCFIQICLSSLRGSILHVTSFSFKHPASGGSAVYSNLIALV